MIDLAMTVYQRVGLKELKLQINSVGDPQCRSAYKNTLQEYLRPNLPQYCPDCQRRFDDNPLRILDCKNPSCVALNAAAPRLTDHLCTECHTHYQQVKDGLRKLDIPFEENPYLVRGLDYYTRTVFEITSGSLGAQNAVCGGGRYDLLAEELGGPPTAAVGFAAGMERLLLAAQAQGLQISPPARLDIFIVSLGQAAQQEALFWLRKLRQQDWRCDGDFLGRSIKAQMREANRQRARFVLILGEDELQNKAFSLKLMDQGEQRSVAFNALIDTLNTLR